MIPKFKSILDLQEAFPDDGKCMDYLGSLRWNGITVSPFDKDSKVYKCKGWNYRCKNTGKYFNAKFGTIFENSNVPLRKWFVALYLFSSHKKGISSHQLAKDIGVTQKSAWFMLHRLRHAFNHPDFSAILGEGNPVEIDETYIGGKEKNKHEYKKLKVGGGTNGKVMVMGLIEREGNLIAKIIPDGKMGKGLSLIYKNVSNGAIIMTDEFTGYNILERSYDRRKVNHSAKEFVNNLAHTNTIENFWSHLKRGLDGIYHWVSKVHLQAYVDEFTLRYNTRRMETAERFNLILGNISGPLRYHELIAKGKNGTNLAKTA